MRQVESKVSKEIPIRRFAAEAIERSDSPEALAVIDAAMSGADEDLRYWAIRARVGGKHAGRSEDVLIDGLELFGNGVPGAEEAYVATCQALASHGTVKCIPPLLAAAERDGGSTRTEKTIDALKSVCRRNPDSADVVGAHASTLTIIALGGHPVLYKQLLSGTVEHKGLAESILDCIQENDVRPSESMEDLLCQPYQRNSWPHMSESLVNRTYSVLINALADLAPKSDRCKEALCRYWLDAVHLHQQAAFARVGPEVVPFLVDAVRGYDSSASKAAYELLGAVGPEALPALASKALGEYRLYARLDAGTPPAEWRPTADWICWILNAYGNLNAEGNTHPRTEELIEILKYRIRALREVKRSGLSPKKPHPARYGTLDQDLGRALMANKNLALEALALYAGVVRDDSENKPFAQTCEYFIEEARKQGYDVAAIEPVTVPDRPVEVSESPQAGSKNGEKEMSDGAISNGNTSTETPTKHATEPASVSSKVRTWTSGNHSVEAEFVWQKDGLVRLRRDDNRKFVDVTLELLSEQDQQYIRDLRQKD